MSDSNQPRPQSQDNEDDPIDKILWETFGYYVNVYNPGELDAYRKRASSAKAAIQAQLDEAEQRGFERGATIYKRELENQKRISDQFIKREQLKIEPAPIRIEVNPKSHTVLTPTQPKPSKEQ